MGFRLGLALALCLIPPPLLPAQSQITTGTIQGEILDPSGAGVPNAKVDLQNIATGVSRTTTTDGEGRFSAPLLQPGDYQITASAPGFATLVRKGYTLALSQSVSANLTLTPATVQETITVTEDAPLVEATRTETTALVDQRSVESLPLNGRRFLDLAALTPGVSQDPERGGISFAGQRGINSNLNIDGADYNQPFFGGVRGGERSEKAYTISQEAIREFQVVRSGFAPEFGRSTGGIVNVITKSGVNDFHGSAFYYLRHREFSPRTIFGDDTAPTRQQFGGSIGGPIKRDRTFFYAVWDQQEEEQALVIRFSNPAGIPADLLAKQGLFKSTNDVKTWLFKGDHQLTGNTSLSGRYNGSRNDALNGTFTGVTTGAIENNGTERDRTHTGVLNVNTIFSASVLNELRTQYSFEDRPRVNNGETGEFNALTGPQVQVSGCCFFGGVSFLPVPQVDDRFQIVDNVSLIKGGHTAKFGVDFNRSSVDQSFRGNWRGVYIFNNVQNFVNTLNKVPGAAPDQFRVAFGPGKFAVNVKEFAFFGQDSWKVNRHLTLTGGLRWEGVWYPQPITPNPLLPQTAKIPQAMDQWQPRLGVAWDLFGNSRTVFRVTSGLFYARTPMLLLSQAFNSNGNPAVGAAFTLTAAQYLSAQSVRPELVYPFVPDTSNAANSSFFTGAGIAGLRPDASFFAPDFKNPRSLNISAGIEQALMSNLALSLEWVHLNTVHLERIRDVNLFPPVIGPDTSTPPQIRPMFNINPRPNTNFGFLRSQESSARSNYDALTLGLNKRFSNKLRFLTSYTLAYNRDDDSNERNFAGITYENAFDLAREYTWSRNDIRHRWVFSGSYDLPWNFQISGILNWRTGLPYNAYTGVDSNRDGAFTDKPIVNGVWFRRNQFRQPNYFGNDLRVTKTFALNDRHRILFITELFNFTNRRNFTYSVSANESSTSTLGGLWGTGQTPRNTFRTFYLEDGSLNRGGANVGSPIQVQLALKYQF